MLDRMYRGLLCVLLVTAAVLALMALLGDGLFVRIGGVRISARGAARPFGAAVAAFLLLVHASGSVRQRVRAALDRAVRIGRKLAWAVAACFALAVLAVGLRYGSFVASAADSYGYVTQAEAFAGGPEITPDPLAASIPWPNALWTLTPLGYLARGATVAPVYPPGYPLLMAGATLIAGHPGVYLVVPVAGVALLIATFLLGRRLGGAFVGLGSGLLLLTSPVFLFHILVPMSDVPAAALWTWALVLILTRSVPSAMASGLLAGVAVLVRPNLAPLLLVLVAAAVPEDRSRERPWRLVAGLVAGAVPGVLTLLVLNAQRYGSPFASGYGPLETLFALRHLPVNIARFGDWFLAIQTPFIFVGLAAAWPSVRRQLAATPDARRLADLLLAQIGAVAACYAFYLPFDNWGYLRFLLPAFPALLVLAITVTRDAVARAPDPFGRIAATAVVLLVAIVTWERAGVNAVFENERSVRRFVDVPEYVAAAHEADAVFLSRVFSGSLRYYGRRRTVRWDVLDPLWLDRAIEELSSRGLTPFIVVEGEELELFRKRFGSSNRWGRLDWPAAAAYRGMETVLIYDPRDQARGAEPSVEPFRIPISARPIPLR